MIACAVRSGNMLLIIAIASAASVNKWGKTADNLSAKGYPQAFSEKTYLKGLHFH